ncbi:MAG: hypothetical protein IPN33_09105 [Saprospiraceae bacterium]|nr:hypothetical protein [Saprospiraceae bacterium]
MRQAELYQSVLRQLSLLPVEYLKLVERFVSGLNQLTQDKKKNRQAILALAGSCSDLSEQDFEDIRSAAKETGNSLFAREIDL